MSKVDEIMALVDRYWSLAYAEGKDGREHDTPDGAAQATRSAIEAALKEREGEAVPECYTLRVIEELNENGDPVSVDAAEEMKRLLGLATAPPKAQPMMDALIDLACSEAGCLGQSEEAGFYHGVKAAERHHKIGE